MEWIAGDENKESLKKRGITFDDLIDAIAEGGLVDVVESRYDDDSQIALIKIGTSLWAAPFEQRDGNFRLITAYKKSQWKKNYPEHFKP